MNQSFSKSTPSLAPDSRYPWLALTTSGSVTLVLGMTCVLALLLQGVLRQQEIAFNRVGLAGLVVAALLALDYFLNHHYGETIPLRIRIAAFAIHIVLVEVMTLLDGLTYTSLIYLTLPFPVSFLFGSRIALLTGTFLALWFTGKFMLMKPSWLNDPALMNTYLLFLVALILMTVMAQVVQQERKNRQRAEGLLRELEQSHQQLAKYAQQVAALATIEERNRVARDIHDSLGHYLTVVGVQLEKALIVYEDSPNETLGAVRHAKRLTDQALTDVRQSVSTLRHDQTPFMLRPALETLINDMRGLPFSVQLHIEGNENLFTKQQLLTIYRAVQEGFTNIQKHAQAKKVDLTVNLNEQQATVTLHDDGIGMENGSRTTGGFGLRGVRERLELINGILTLRPVRGGGTEFYVCIPRSNPLNAAKG